MRLLTFVRFIRMITKDGPADLDKIQDMGLLAVKLTQIFNHYHWSFSNDQNSHSCTHTHTLTHAHTHTHTHTRF